MPGIEAMVGLFINTVPVRVPLDPAGAGSATCSARLQDEQAALMEHQHVGLADIQRRPGR